MSGILISVVAFALFAVINTAMKSTTTHPIKRTLTSWLVWGLCVLVAIATVYTIGDVLLYYAPESGPLRTIGDILSTLLPLVCAVLAALIVLRKPGNAIGWLLFGPACAALLDVVGSATVQKLTAPPPDPSLLFRFAVWLDSVNWILFVFPILLILVLFPTGRPPSPRWNWVVVLALGMVAFDLSLTTFAQYWESPNTAEAWRIVNPFGFIPNEALDVVFDVPWLIALGILTVSSMAALIWRYRRSSFVERAQIKWPLFASAVFGVVYVVYVAVVSGPQLGDTALADDLVNFLLSLASLAVPIAIGVAILRHRLWNIDVIIRRTLIYGALSGLLLLVYFGIVVLTLALVAVLGPVIGPSFAPSSSALDATALQEQSQLPLTIATLAIAGLFLPLRRAVQNAIDRRFYRRKYDAEKAIAALSARIQNEVDVACVTGELMDVVDETLEPAHMSLWLKTTTADRRPRSVESEMRP